MRLKNRQLTINSYYLREKQGLTFKSHIPVYLKLGSRKSINTLASPCCVFMQLLNGDRTLITSKCLSTRWWSRHFYSSDFITSWNHPFHSELQTLQYELFNPPPLYFLLHCSLLDCYEPLLPFINILALIWILLITLCIQTDNWWRDK